MGTKVRSLSEEVLCCLEFSSEEGLLSLAACFVARGPRFCECLVCFLSRSVAV